MEALKPGVDLPGYDKALKEYGSEPARIVEELVANSYDADAKNVLVVHGERHVAIIDDGTGISNDQFQNLLRLGAGSKIDGHESELKRSYLGAFGFGVKSTLNVSKSVTVITINRKATLTCGIDVGELRRNFKNKDWLGFPVQEAPAPGKATGTLIWLELSSELKPEQVKNIRTSLFNLPKSKDFNVLLIDQRQARDVVKHPEASAIETVPEQAKKHKSARVTGTLQLGEPSLEKCSFAPGHSIDISVWCKGLDSNLKVESLGQFAGVYVKVDGRVLKNNFQGEKVLDNVSKYPKFKHGMRVEVPLDWLKSDISLGRDGVQFQNEGTRQKFEAELKVAVTAAVRPFAKQLENRKQGKVAKEMELRQRKARERIEEKQVIKELEGTGFAFVPGDDYEMALIVSNPKVLRKLNPNWTLLDFNGQKDVDCLIYDEQKREYFGIELEPSLECILQQGVIENTDFIVTWTQGKWGPGKQKKGKKGWYELLENKDGDGHYKLLNRKSKRSKPRQEIRVYCIDKVIKHL